MKNDARLTRAGLRTGCFLPGCLAAFLVLAFPCGGDMRVEPEWLNVWAGETVRVTVDVAAPDEEIGEIAWAAGVFDTAIASGKATATSGTATFEVQAPAAERVVLLAIEIRAEAATRTLAATEQITVFPRIEDEAFRDALGDVRPLVLDPGGELRAFLEQISVPYRTLRNWAALPSEETPSVILVGPDAVVRSRIVPQDLLAEPPPGVQQTVVVFRQESIPPQWHKEWFRHGIEIRANPKDVASTTLEVSSCTYNAASNADKEWVINWMPELRTKTFRSWRGGSIGRALYGRPHRGNADSVLVGEPSPILLDVWRGNRRIQFCQCPVIRTRAYEPAAAYLLRGLLHRAVREAPRSLVPAHRLRWQRGVKTDEEDRWSRIGLGVDSRYAPTLLNTEAPGLQGAWFFAGVPPVRIRGWSQQNLATEEILTRLFDSGGALLVLDADFADIDELLGLVPWAERAFGTDFEERRARGVIGGRYPLGPPPRLYLATKLSDRLDEDPGFRLMADRFWVGELTHFGIQLSATLQD